MWFHRKSKKKAQEQKDQEKIDKFIEFLSKKLDNPNFDRDVDTLTEDLIDAICQFHPEEIAKSISKVDINVRIGLAQKVSKNSSKYLDYHKKMTYKLKSFLDEHGDELSEETLHEINEFSGRMIPEIENRLKILNVVEQILMV